RIRTRALTLAGGLRALRYDVADGEIFDSVRVECGAERDAILVRAVERGINLRPLGDTAIVVAFDETVSESDVDDVLGAFARDSGSAPSAAKLVDNVDIDYPDALARTSDFM